ncbi:MAG: hypothetical protein HZA32_13290 [Opitutae bacterium]|nr:hypothetical protein [Opitutae bacterium]
MLDLISDLLQFALGLACIALGFLALAGPEANWAGKRLQRFIDENWAGGTARSHRNLALASLIMGIVIAGGIAASWFLN